MAVIIGFLGAIFLTMAIWFGWAALRAPDEVDSRAAAGFWSVAFGLAGILFLLAAFQAPAGG